MYVHQDQHHHGANEEHLGFKHVHAEHSEEMRAVRDGRDVEGKTPGDARDELHVRHVRLVDDLIVEFVFHR